VSRGAPLHSRKAQRGRDWVTKAIRKTEKEQLLMELNKAVCVVGNVGGVVVSAAQMKPIILVTLDGVRPLQHAIELLR
jgi:hypothetical protein